MNVDIIQNLTVHKYLKLRVGELKIKSRSCISFLHFYLSIYVVCVSVSVCVQLLSSARFFATPWTKPTRLLCPWGFSRQEYWSGLPFPTCLIIHTLIDRCI